MRLQCYGKLVSVHLFATLRGRPLSRSVRLSPILFAIVSTHLSSPYGLPLVIDRRTACSSRPLSGMCSHVLH